MAIEVIAKIKPKNNGDFALVDAKDIELPDGSRLSDANIGGNGETVAELDIFPEQELAFTAVSETVYACGFSGSSVIPAAGEVYTVAWGEEEYTCTAVETLFDESEAVGIGNMAIMGLGEDTGEPFLFAVLKDGSEIGFFTASGDGCTVRVYQVLYPAMLPEIGDVHEGKIPQVVGGELVYGDPKDLRIDGVKLDTYIGNAVNSYIEEALGGDY